VVPHLAQVLGLESKAQRRVLHGALMGAAFVFAVLGYVIIFVTHARIDESQIGLNTTWDRSLHVWMGYVTLTWLCLVYAPSSVCLPLCFLKVRSMLDVLR